MSISYAFRDMNQEVKILNVLYNPNSEMTLLIFYLENWNYTTELFSQMKSHLGDKCAASVHLEIMRRQICYFWH